MRESRTPGSVRGAASNCRPYRDQSPPAFCWTEARMAGREVAVKKYVVRLSAEERERLEDLRSKGTIPARRLFEGADLVES